MAAAWLGRCCGRPARCLSGVPWRNAFVHRDFNCNFNCGAGHYLALREGPGGKSEGDWIGMVRECASVHDLSYKRLEGEPGLAWRESVLVRMTCHTENWVGLLRCQRSVVVVCRCDTTCHRTHSLSGFWMNCHHGVLLLTVRLDQNGTHHHVWRCGTLEVYPFVIQVLQANLSTGPVHWPIMTCMSFLHNTTN
jgi:hypothetical protein